VPEAVIEIAGLTRDFGTLRAVDRIDLTVHEGEIYGLLGPNGAGKTTTLRMLAGLLTPTAGDAFIDGASALEHPLAVKSKLGYLTGDTALYGRLTPREILRFFARLNGREATWIEQRIRTLVAELDLTEFADRRCEKLSSGQRQRTAIARALAHDPRVLVLDEPTATLDVVSARFILERLQAEAAAGKAVLLSTHHMAEAELVCHRLGVIHRGRLLAEGTVEELLEQTQKVSLAQAFLHLIDAGDQSDDAPTEAG
jgi:sodium transport system ATP-binding protein